MATKKTTASKTTSTQPDQAKTPPAASSAGASSAGSSFADSPAPENCRLDPGTARSAYFNSLAAAGEPRPVFSTLALQHGKDASGMRRFKPGFAWNERMDLLWALGFPRARILVDGVAQAETIDGVKEIFPGTSKYLRTVLAEELIVPRRVAFAYFLEVETMENPLELSEAKFKKLTAPRELSRQDVAELLDAEAGRKLLFTQTLALLLEAVVGTRIVAEELVRILGDAKARAAGSTAGAAIVFGDLLDRLPTNEREELLAAALRAPLSDYEKTVIGGNPKRNASPEQVLEQVLAQKKQGRCWPPLAFDGPPRVRELMAERFKTYDKLDIAYDYRQILTSIRGPLLLEAQVQVLAFKEEREAMLAWFNEHASELTPDLERLAKAGSKPAAAALKAIG